MSPTEPRSTRAAALRFGAGGMLVFGLIGLWLDLRKHRPSAGLASAGAGALLLAIAGVAPSIALRLRAGWMHAAHALGWVNTRILLGLFFFGVLTPVALVRRVFGSPVARDQEKSHWRLRDKADPKHYEHPF